MTRKKSAFAKCVGSKLRGKHHRTRTAQRAAFRRAVKACAGRRSHRRVRHHRRHRRRR